MVYKLYPLTVPDIVPDSPRPGLELQVLHIRSLPRIIVSFYVIGLTRDFNCTIDQLPHNHRNRLTGYVERDHQMTSKYLIANALDILIYHL